MFAVGSRVEEQGKADEGFGGAWHPAVVVSAPRGSGAVSVRYEGDPSSEPATVARAALRPAPPAGLLDVASLRVGQQVECRTVSHGAFRVGKAGGGWVRAGSASHGAARSPPHVGSIWWQGVVTSPAGSLVVSFPGACRALGSVQSFGAAPQRSLAPLKPAPNPPLPSH